MLRILFDRLVKCRACKMLVHGPFYCNNCGEKL